MNKKSKLLMGSIATIAMCTSLVVGGTYALFTDKSEVNVAVSSGKVDVKAYIDRASVKTYSAEWNTDAYEIVENAGLTFATDVDGTPSVVLATDDNKLTIAQMVAGDKVTFDLVLENLSDVKIQYQTVIKALNDTGLFQDLDVTIGEAKFTPAAPEVYSNWLPLAPGSDAIVIPVEIAMPLGDTVLDEDYWNNLVEDQYANSKSCEIAYSIRAVQGNAHVVNPGATDDPNEIIIDTVSELYAFAQDVNVNGNTYAGKTVYLGANLDLGGMAWTPIGQTGTQYAKTYFQGIFDGQNYTISNFKIEGEAGRGQHYASGFFGFTDAGSNTIKNVKLSDFTVEGEHWVGGIVGYATADVINCEVSNATIIGKYDNDDRDGDKVGGVVGYANNCVIDGCKATNVTVKASRDVAPILGGGYGDVKNCVSKNCDIVISRPVGYSKAPNPGEIVGRHITGVAENNVATGNEFVFEVNGKVNFDTAKTFLTGVNNVTIQGVSANAEINLTGTQSNAVKFADFNAKTVVKDVKLTDVRLYGSSHSNHYDWFTSFVGEDLTLTNVTFMDSCKVEDAESNVVFNDCYFTADLANSYAVMALGGNVTFNNCIVDATTGERGAKVGSSDTWYDDYADAVVFDGCTFISSTRKPGVVVSTLLPTASVTIKNNKFINCLDKDDEPFVEEYICASDTDFAKFTYVSANNVVENTAGTVVASSAAFNNALGTADEITVYGTVSRSKAVTNTTVKGAGAENSEIVMNPVYGQSFGTGDVAFEDITITNTSNAHYAGFHHSVSETYKNCVINGQYFTYGEEVVFENCTFVQTDANNYNIWTYGAKKVTFINCTFNSAGKAVLIYNEGVDFKTEVNFEGCTFNASAPVEGKAAIEIDSSHATNGLYTVNINDTKAVVGFAEGSVSGDTLWNNKNGENTIVNVDSVRVF